MTTEWEKWHTDECGDEWRTRFNAKAAPRGGFFSIVAPGDRFPSILLSPSDARELRDRINEYLGENDD